MFSKDANYHLRDLARFNDHLGWSQRLRSLDYFRCLEYQLILRALRTISSECPLLLEWGVGTSPLPPYLAQKARVIAMDLDPASCTWQTKVHRAFVHRAFNAGDPNAHPRPHHTNLPAPATLTTICANGLALPMTASSVDIAIAVGALEHALEDLAQTPDTPRSRDCGDTLALQELARVLRPGAALLMTVPWSTEFSYSQDSPHTKTFERRYDDQALVDRLIRPSGLREVSRSYFGEPGFPFSSYWYKLPFFLKLPFRRTIPWASSRFLAELPNTSDGTSDAPSDAPDHACGIFLWLEKPTPEASPL